MSPEALKAAKEQNGFPRVSGDEPASTCSGVAACTFSPRERG